MGECNNPYADFARRMLAEQEAAKKAASEAGDYDAFQAAEREAANYAAMLADDVKRCGCGGKCGLSD